MRLAELLTRNSTSSGRMFAHHISFRPVPLAAPFSRAEYIEVARVLE
jgi:hypothetical protein